MNQDSRYSRRPSRPRDRSNFGGTDEYEDEEYGASLPQEPYRRKIIVNDPPSMRRRQFSYAENEPEYVHEEEAPPYDDPAYAYEGDYDETEYEDDYEDELEPLDDDLTEYDEFGRKRKPGRPRESKSRIVWGWILSIAAAIAIAFIVRTFLFEIIMVDGVSMQPTLETDERLAVEKVSRYFGLPEHGDIIIVHYPDMEGTYVKRVIGLPGDTIEVKDSTVYRNGQALEESYINHEPYMDMEPVTVPEDTVFVMGDNRAHSLDSRTSYIGPIARDEIVGHAMAVIWPFDNMHSVN